MAKNLFVVFQFIFLVAGTTFLFVETRERLDATEGLDTSSLVYATAVGITPTIIGLLLLFSVWFLNFYHLAETVGKKAKADKPVIFFVGQLGKYIPGPLMGTVGHGLLSKNHSSIRGGVFASLKATGYAVVSAATLSAFLLDLSSEFILAIFAALILANLVSVTKYPDQILWRLLRASRPKEHSYQTARRILSLANSYFLWIFFGGAVYLVAQVSADGSGLDFWSAVAAYAASHAAGILAVFAPAGMGVREVVFENVMKPFMDQDSAFITAALTRIVHVISDAIMAALAVILLILNKASTPRK